MTQHKIKTRARRGTVTVIEGVDRIDFKMEFDRYGDFGDLPELMRQLIPITAPYDSDPRPLHIAWADLGQRVTVDFNAAGQVFGVVEAETRQ